MKFLNFLSTFVGHFCPPGSGSGFRIRILNPCSCTETSTKNADGSRIPFLESGERTVRVAEKAGRRARLLVGGFVTKWRRGQGQLLLCGVHSVRPLLLLLFLLLQLFFFLLFLFLLVLI